MLASPVGLTLERPHDLEGSNSGLGVPGPDAVGLRSLPSLTFKDLGAPAWCLQEKGTGKLEEMHTWARV